MFRVYGSVAAELQSGLSGTSGSSGYLVEYANDWGNLHEFRPCTGTKEESYHMVVE